MSAVIESVKIFWDVACPKLLAVAQEVTAQYQPHTSILTLPAEHASFVEWWESEKGNYWPVVDNKVHPLKVFECFVTDKFHVNDAAVAYALYAKAIPVLSLASRTSALKTKSPLFEDVESLCCVGKAEDAIKQYLSFPQRPGRVFVIEGGDGAGKQTQVSLLVNRLKDEGRLVQTLDYPHDAARFGVLIRELLSGKMGNIKQVNPLIFAALYGLNRHDTLPQLRLWVQRGCNIVLDRYMTANFGHQASKYDKDSDRIAAIETLKHFEVSWLSLPEAHRVVYLNLPPEYALRAMQSDGTRRELDMHEKAGMDYKNNVRRSFLWCCETFPEWKEIPCVDGTSARLSRAEVHESLYTHLCSEFV